MENICPRLAAPRAGNSGENLGIFCGKNIQKKFGSLRGGCQDPPAGREKSKFCGKNGIFPAGKGIFLPLTRAGINPAMIFPGENRDGCPSADSAVVH